MTKLKVALLIAVLIAATLLPSLRLRPAESLLGWSAQPVVTYACDPGGGGTCGG